METKPNPTDEEEKHKKQMAVEHFFSLLTLSELQAEKTKTEEKVRHLQSELNDLAFHNYRTYVDIGRTAEHCKDMLATMNTNMRQLKTEYPAMVSDIQKFKEASAEIVGSCKTLDKIGSAGCQIWTILKLPKLMEKCIRTGRFEQAYALTNFAMSLKQSKLMQNACIKSVIDHLLEARYGLLDELFNKFAGPIDLAKSIQVVNNIRKIPYISNTQLRVSILRYRDIYLEKSVLGIMSEPDYLLRVIDVYRECMYDTIVLYLSVFPDVDVQKKFHSSANDDLRWERWTGSSQTYLLQSWAQHNIEKLFLIIKGTEQKTLLDIEAMISKLMSFAFSFGRMGLDFRSLVHQEFSQIIADIFKQRVDLAANSFVVLTRLDLIDGYIFENTRKDLEEEGTDRTQLESGMLHAPLELSVWDDICVFGNRLIEALNDIRHFLSGTLIREIFASLMAALQITFKWLDSFASKADHLAKVRRAVELLLVHFVPHLNRCFFHCFPYEQCIRQHFKASYCSEEQYREAFLLNTPHLFSLCTNDVFMEIFEGIKASELENGHLDEPTEREKIEENLEIIEEEGNGKEAEEPGTKVDEKAETDQ